MIKHNILITGGAGFIGSHLTRVLIERGHKVTIFDNLLPQIHGETPDLSHIHEKAVFYRGDVRNAEDWRSALQGQTAVVHLAAETGTGQSMYEIDRYSEVNIGGTAKMLDLLANSKHGIQRLVVASSRAIYGEGRHRCEVHGVVYPEPRKEANMLAGDFAVKCPYCNYNTELLPTDEESKIHPSSVYGISKQVQEQLVLTVAAGLGISSVALRYQNVYGPGQSLHNPYTGILSIFSTRLLNGHDLTIFEDGLESRDFVYIDDVVEATALAVERPLEMENDVASAISLNVGSGVRTNVGTVARTLRTLLKADCELLVSGNFRVGDIRDNFADLSKVQARLGFKPKVDFSTGIGRFVKWVNSQKISNDGFDRSISELKTRGLYK